MWSPAGSQVRRSLLTDYYTPPGDCVRDILAVLTAQLNHMLELSDAGVVLSPSLSVGEKRKEVRQPQQGEGGTSWVRGDFEWCPYSLTASQAGKETGAHEEAHHFDHSRRKNHGVSQAPRPARGRNE